MIPVDYQVSTFFVFHSSISSSSPPDSRWLPGEHFLRVPLEHFLLITPWFPLITRWALSSCSTRAFPPHHPLIPVDYQVSTFFVFYSSISSSSPPDSRWLPGEHFLRVPLEHFLLITPWFPLITRWALSSCSTRAFPTHHPLIPVDYQVSTFFVFHSSISSSSPPDSRWLPGEHFLRVPLEHFLLITPWFPLITRWALSSCSTRAFPPHHPMIPVDYQVSTFFVFHSSISSSSPHDSRWLPGEHFLRVPLEHFLLITPWFPLITRWALPSCSTRAFPPHHPLIPVDYQVSTFFVFHSSISYSSPPDSRWLPGEHFLRVPLEHFLLITPWFPLITRWALSSCSTRAFPPHHPLIPVDYQVSTFFVFHSSISSSSPPDSRWLPGEHFLRVPLEHFLLITPWFPLITRWALSSCSTRAFPPHHPLIPVDYQVSTFFVFYSSISSSSPLDSRWLPGEHFLRVPLEHFLLITPWFPLITRWALPSCSTRAFPPHHPLIPVDYQVSTFFVFHSSISSSSPPDSRWLPGEHFLRVLLEHFLLITPWFPLITRWALSSCSTRAFPPHHPLIPVDYQVSTFFVFHSSISSSSPPDSRWLPGEHFLRVPLEHFLLITPWFPLITRWALSSCSTRAFPTHHPLIPVDYQVSTFFVFHSSISSSSPPDSRWLPGEHFLRVLLEHFLLITPWFPLITRWALSSCSTRAFPPHHPLIPVDYQVSTFFVFYSSISSSSPPDSRWLPGEHFLRVLLEHFLLITPWFPLITRWALSSCSTRAFPPHHPLDSRWLPGEHFLRVPLEHFLLITPWFPLITRWALSSCSTRAFPPHHPLILVDYQVSTFFVFYSSFSSPSFPYSHRLSGEYSSLWCVRAFFLKLCWKLGCITQ